MDRLIDTSQAFDATVTAEIGGVLSRGYVSKLRGTALTAGLARLHPFAALTQYSTCSARELGHDTVCSKRAPAPRFDFEAGAEPAGTAREAASDFTGDTAEEKWVFDDQGAAWGWCERSQGWLPWPWDEVKGWAPELHGWGRCNEPLRASGRRGQRGGRWAAWYRGRSAPY